MLYLKLLTVGLKEAHSEAEIHPFKKSFDDLSIGDTIFSEEKSQPKRYQQFCRIYW